MMNISFDQLLDVRVQEERRFASIAHRENFNLNLFGGQVLAQALMAASKTCPDRTVHSMHAYFIRAGSSDQPIYYDVEILRDGRSISNRHVRAVQKNKVIFQLSLSFHEKESGFEHQSVTAPAVASPEELLQQQTPSEHAPEYKEEASSPFQLLAVPENLFLSHERHKPEAYFWLKTVETLSANNTQQHISLHQAALAFASDLGLLATALLPHPSSLFSKNIRAASIDHSMWFHSDTINVNDWLLCHTVSPWANHARGFAHATIFDRSGKLIASTSQEGLIRPR